MILKRDLPVIDTSWLKPFQDFIARMNEITNRISLVKLPIPSDKISRLFAELNKQSENNRKLEKAGWLPHYTTPFADLDFPKDSPKILEEKIHRHYRKNWNLVERQFRNRLKGYSIDNEAKDAFREALRAHKWKCYRAVVRLIFPEIERVVRREIAANPHKPVTSQHELRHRAGTILPFQIEPQGNYGLELYRLLTDHLYLKYDVQVLNRSSKWASVPNRHAALHGLVTYSTFQHSINALIIADFIFQVVTALKNPLED